MRVGTPLWLAWAVLCACPACSRVLDFDETTGAAEASDAGRDAGSPDAVVPGPGFCASLPDQAFFCDDFDDIAGLFQRWTAIIQERGTVSIDSLASLSPPSAFLAKVESSGVGEAPDAGSSIDGGAVPTIEVSQAGLILELADLAQRSVAIVVSVNVGIEAHPTDQEAYATILGLLYESEESSVYLDLDLKPNEQGLLSLYLDEYGGTDPDAGTLREPEQLPGEDLETFTWYYIELRVELGQPTGEGNSFSVSINGEPRLARQLRTSTRSGTPVVGLGVLTSNSAPWQLRYDDFVVRAEDVEP